MYLSLHEVALLKDLDHGVLLLRGAEFGLESALGSRVEGTLVAVPVSMSALLFRCMCTIARWWLGLLVGDKDLEAVDNLSERHALVLLPLLNGLDALDEDNEVLAVALVVALGLGGVSAHVGCVVSGWFGLVVCGVGLA
jgi:hypothetical protein